MMIRTHDDIDEATLTTAEKTLLENCRAGEPTVLGDGKLPAGPSDARSVRADLLRYLICGGCETYRTTDRGIDLKGAYISRNLDLDFASARGGTRLSNCRFFGRVLGTQARFRFLNLSGSHFMLGVHSLHMRVNSNLDLVKIVAAGEVNFGGSRIGGQLVCNNARFSRRTGHDLVDVQVRSALILEGIKVGTILMRSVKVDGDVKLGQARISGDLDLSKADLTHTKPYALMLQDARIAGNVYLRAAVVRGGAIVSGTKVRGQLECDGAQFFKPDVVEGNITSRNLFGHDELALNVQGMEAEVFIWRKVGAVTGRVHLSGACIGTIVDDAASWALIDNLALNGFRYQRIHGPMDTRTRLGWLAKDATTSGEFRPQPYEQLAHVMQGMGHTGDARRVRLEKEILLSRDWKRRALDEQKLLRERRDAQVTPPDYHQIQNRLAILGLELRIMPLWHGALRTMVGYGHAPQRVLYWVVGTIAVMGSFYLWVWNFGGMVPNSDIILTSPHWAQAMVANPDMPALAWEASELGQHYQTFAAATYAADVFIPLVDLGQEAAWTATTATAWGRVAWVLSWFLKLFGWIVTAVGAAAITGIIRRE